MDTSGFDALRPPPDLLSDPRRVRADNEEQAEALRRLRERLRDLVGTASSDDGLVRAVATDSALRDLHLDPRAMRKASVDLAEEIVTVVQAARDDFERQRQEIVAELGVQAQPVDLDAVLGQLREVGEAFTRGTGDMQALVERFARQAGGR